MPVAADTADQTADCLSQGPTSTVAAEKGRGQRGGVTTPRTTLNQDLAEAGLLPTAGSVRRVSDPVEADFLNAGGWRVVSIKGGDEEGGVTSHRGVLHPNEHVDDELLQLMIERRLGFSYEQIRSVYRQGPLSSDQRELRGQIDARLLALSRSGGSLIELGRWLGFQIKDDGHCRVIENALRRAREEEGSTPSSSPEDSRHPRTPSGSLDGDRQNESTPGTSSTTATSMGGTR